jgi:hypothetical protein
MIRLLEKGKRGIVETSGSNNRIVIPGFNETALKSQPDIRRLLEHAERAFLKLKTETSGVEIEAEQNTAKYNCAAGLYSAIEWTLRQIVYRFPAGRFDEILKRGSLRENTLMLEEFAGKLGFKLTDNNRLLLNIPKEKFARIANGAAELTPLLGLCITGAFDDFIHPFNQLGREFPELLSFLLDLKEVRDAESHGNLKSLKSLTKNRMAYFRGNVHVLILTLLPELRQTENGEEEEADQDDIIFDRRIAARFEVDKIFGLQTIDNLKPDMREVLVQCELKCEDLKQNRESASHMNAEITKLLASLLQDAVFNRVKQLREKEFNEIGWQVRIKDSVLKAGFRLENDELPESIRYVAQRRIRRACFRISSSLGANLIALIMLSDEGSLKALAEKIPDLIIRADNLLQLRNHGNNELEMPENEVIELKEEIYHITKIFLEV